MNSVQIRVWQVLFFLSLTITLSVPAYADTISKIKEGALKIQVQHYRERMLHGKTLQAVEY